MSHGDSMHRASGSNRECRPAGALLIRVAIATLCLPVHGCDLGSGGAVELSWALRPASSASADKFVNCQADSSDAGWGPVALIRLHWQVGATEGSHAWTCGANHGATGFELAEGTANLSLTPECSDGQAAASDTYIAPAIVQREVIRGETVSLGAVELVVSVTGCASAAAGNANHGTGACICAAPP
jgi:hypothetical protein